MIWTVSITASAAVLVVSIVLSILIGIGKYRRGRLSSPLHVLFFGVFLAVFLCLIPIFLNMLPDRSGIKALLFSLHGALQIFTIDIDRSLITENIACPSPWLSDVYSTYLSFAYVLAPILTFSFLVSFFKNLSSYLKYILHFFRDAYIFSELNENSLSLAADLLRNHKKATVVFTNVFLNNEETPYELFERARELNAICFKKDILAVNFKFHYKKSQISFFTIGKEETENLQQALRLIEDYRDRDNASLFVFSTGIEGELLLTQIDKGKLKVRRVNKVRSLINRILYEDGNKIFEHAIAVSEKEKQISAVIIGLGQYGTEMLKALAWFCQMDGYHVQIDVFDWDPYAGERFEMLAPELISERYNGVSVPGEAEYTIRIHPGYDVTTQLFADQIMKLNQTTYVLVSLGSDEMNIRSAVDMRMLFERMGIKPMIQTVLYSTSEKEALTGIKNYRGQPYDIDFVGDVQTEAVIIHSDLEAEALKRHLKWGNEDEFWRYEYNYKSSIASAIHRKARIFCNIPGAQKSEDELTPEERNTIEVLEHRRWNAYMRSEGYVFSGSHDKSSRNDLGKMHHDLVYFELLDEDEKRKDGRVGTN